MAKKKERRIYCVYCHTVRVNQLKYFGLAKGDPEIRWGKNGIGYKTQYFWQGICEYGWDNIDHDILMPNLTLEEAISWEIALIAMWRTTDPKYGYNVSTGGEHHDPIIRPVINLETKEVFESTYDACVSIGLKKHANIATCCKCPEKTLGGYHWTYYDKKKPMEYYDEMLKNVPLKNWYPKPVIQLETLEVYETIISAKRAMGLTGTGIDECCENEYGTAGGYHWAYYDNSKSESYYKDLLQIIIDKPSNHLKPVICIETLNTYESVVEASRQVGVNHPHISDCCNDIRITVGGYHWQYYDKEKGLDYYKNLTFRTQKFRDVAVICLETLQVYKSATEAAEKIGVNVRCHISSCCKGNRNIAGGYHWCFYDNEKPLQYYTDLLDQKLKDEQCAIDKPVVLIETKQIYNSAREAAKENGINRPEHIIDNCVGILKSTGGFHWAFYEADKPLEEYDSMVRKNSRCSPVMIVETGKTFETVTKASEYIGLSRGAIQNCLSGKNPTAGGYHWKYAEEEKA